MGLLDGLFGGGQQAQMQAQAPGQGLLSGSWDEFTTKVGDMRQNNPEAFLALGAGLLDGDMAAGARGMARAMADYRGDKRQADLQREGWDRQDKRFDKSFALDQARFDNTVAAQGTERAQEQQRLNASMQWAEGTNDPEVIALGRMGMWSEAFKLNQQKQGLVGDLQFKTLPDGTYGTFNPAGGKFEPLGSAPKPSGSGTSIRLADGTSIDIGGKIPSGFEPDPANPGGIRPISGGPGEQISGELAARLGLADSFIQDAQSLRPRVAAGEVTGPLDRLQAGNNQSSDQAAVYRNLQSGTDALQRMLTGAGMPQAEAEQYARRYLPTFTDNSESATMKLDQLVKELERVKSVAMRGRGGSAPMSQPSAPGASNRTSNGLSWSAQ
ncbi:MAG: hypothetical protein CL627_14575 [Aurantimonas sp.]|nr:hypothetical protein [Aurantimonas sp.]